MGNTGLLLAAGVGVAAYLTRDQWLPAVTGAGPTGTGATGNHPTAPTTSTSNKPVGGSIPGATPLGDQGCYQYSNGTDGQTIINCPPGVSPPPTTQTNNCAAGFTRDAAGICTRYPDAYLLANLNTIPWTGLADIPQEQITRIDPQILGMYSTTTGVNAGTALAFLLGLGGAAPDGTMKNGSDGNTYKSLNGIFYRQGTATSLTTPRNGRVGRLGGTLGDIAAALPITSATLIMASADPRIAALVGRDDRAMLTAAQWNGFYTQATGIVQGVPLHPGDDPQALMSAEQYQARRRAAGLQTTTNLGTVGVIRNSRRGAFPLGGIRSTNSDPGQTFTTWVPPGNRNIYQIPGRGAVPAGTGGTVPPPRPNLRGLGAVVSAARMGLIFDGGGDHRWARSPFPRPAWWREAE